MLKYILFIFIFSISNAQTLKGIYFERPLTSAGDSKEQLSEYAKKTSVFSYTYSSSQSLQELLSKGGTQVDTITKVYKEYNDLEVKSPITTIKPAKTAFRKDFKNNSLECYFVINKEEIYVKDKIQNNNWNLVDEYKIILGFNCRKATTTKTSFGVTQNIVAWFTEDIPVNDGPKDFNDLPGFILELSSEYFIIQFTEIKYLKDTLSDIKNITTVAKPLTIKELEMKWK